MTVPWTEGCWCGVNKDKESCTNILGQRKTKCRCFKTKSGCNAACGCKNCTNPLRTKHLLIPYRAKLCRAKFSSGETIRRAKFSSLKEKFVTFARRKVSPNKIKSVLKWSISEPTSDLSHLDKLWLHWWAKLCRAKFSSGEIIRRAKFSSLFKKFVTFARQSFTR